MMKWLLVLIVLYVVGQMIALLPSAGERRRMRSRNAAVAAGFRIESLERDSRLAASLAGEGLYYYWRPWPPEQRGRHRGDEARLVRFGPENPSLSADAEAGSLIGRLDALASQSDGSLLGYRRDARGEGFIWDEQAAPGLLRQVMEAFRTAEAQPEQIP